MNKQLEKQMLSDILTSYKSYSKPDFNFVLQNMDRNKYNILAHVMKQSDFTDNTELNYDVCTSLQMKYNKKILCIYVSLVGQYCFLTDNKHVIAKDNATDKIQLNLIGQIEKAGLILLKEEQLLHKLPIAIKSTDDEKHSSVLSLLFSPGLQV